MKRFMAMTMLLASVVGCVQEVDEAVVSLDESEMSTNTPRAIVARRWTIVVDPDVPDSVYDIVVDAARDWEENVPCPTTIGVERGTTAKNLDGERSEPGTIELWPQEKLPEPWAMGWGLWWKEQGSFVAYVPPRNEQERSDLGRVIRHELGHAMRVDHLNVPSVMQEPASSFQSIQPVDAEAYGAIWCS